MSTRPSVGGAAGADQLFLARAHARHDQGALIERQDLAERVVAPHRDDPRGARPSAPRAGCRNRRGRSSREASRRLRRISSRSSALMKGPEHHRDRPDRGPRPVSRGRRSPDAADRRRRPPPPTVTSRAVARYAREGREPARSRNLAAQKARPGDAGREARRCPASPCQRIVEIAAGHRPRRRRRALRAWAERRRAPIRPSAGAGESITSRKPSTSVVPAGLQPVPASVRARRAGRAAPCRR